MGGGVGCDLFKKFIIIVIIITYVALWSLVTAKMLQNTEIQGEHLVWTVGNADPMHEVCIPHSIPQAWKQQERRKR